jgi:hypothetical protein
VINREGILMLSVSFSGSYTYTITERKKINGEKVEKVRSISKREYEVCDISTIGIISSLLCHM